MAIVWLLCATLAATLPASAAADSPAAGSIEELWSRGEAAFKIGLLQEAQQLFEAALAADKRRAHSWNYLNGVHFVRGDFTRAHEEFRTALQLDPRDVRAANNLGSAMERLGDYTGAALAYARAEQIDPSYPPTQRNLGILQLRRLADPEAARRAWQRYLELAPGARDAPEIRNELAALPNATAAPLATAPAPLADAPPLQVPAPAVR